MGAEQQQNTTGGVSVTEANRTVERNAAQRSESLIAQFAKQQNAIFAREAAGESDDTATETPAAKTTPKPKAAPPKGPDGKFVSPAKAPAAETSNEPANQEEPADAAEEAAEPADDTEEETAPGTFAQARRLLGEAMAGDEVDLQKVDKAFKLAFGKGIDELPKPAAKHFHALRQQHKAGVAKLEAERAAVEQRVDAIVKAYQPFAEAKKAYASGDYAAAVKSAFGVDVNTFQKQLLGKWFGSAPERQDPETAALRAELEALRKEREEEKKAAQKATEQQQAEQRRNEWRAGISKSLQASGDARFAKLATKPAFVARVHELQEQNYDPSDKTTIATLEAAELVYDEYYAGVLDGDEGDRGATSPETTTDRAREHVRQPARKPGRRLNTSVASEASSPPKFKNKQDLMAHYVRSAQAQLAREQGGIG